MKIVSIISLQNSVMLNNAHTQNHRWRKKDGRMNDEKRQQKNECEWGDNNWTYSGECVQG